MDFLTATKEVLGDFDGVLTMNPQNLLEISRAALISDFFSAYNKLPYQKQKCLVHLLRESHSISRNSVEAKHFHKKIKRFVKDASKFKKENHPQHEIAKAKKRFQRKLKKIIAGPYTDCDCIKLAKRLNQHYDSLLTFLEVESVDCNNNKAERIIRSSVVIKKSAVKAIQEMELTYMKQ